MEEKEQRWQEVYDTFTRTTDALGMPIDEKILDTVVVLNLLGLETQQSCEGHMEHGNAYPWITIGTQDIDTLLEKMVSLQDDIDAKEKERDYSYDEAVELYAPYHELREQIEIKGAQMILPLQNYLHDFYTQQSYSEYHRILMLIQSTMGTFCLQPQGSDLQVIQPHNIKQQRLQDYQNDMKAFTLFLKRTYFHGESHKTF